MQTNKINYKKYQKTIYHLAHRYTKTTGIEFNELVSAANEHFMKIQCKFDPSKACFNTYLTIELKGLFWSMSKKKKNNFNSLNDNISKYDNPERTCLFANILNELSQDAKEIVRIIFNTPAELINILPQKQPRGVNEAILTKYLKNDGWPISKIYRAFDDIKAIWN